jgi:glycosyltransferase involved in cell wall biosynthesis
VLTPQQRQALGSLSLDYFCPSIRMSLQTAVALESENLLRSAHVDACLLPGKLAEAIERLGGPRVANRIVAGIPGKRIHRHPQLMVANRVLQRLNLSGRDTTAVARVLGRMYSSVARRCDSEAVVGTQYSCLELFEGRKYRIMEQVAAPPRYERALTSEELARFPGWAEAGVVKPSLWDDRVEAELRAADVIWAPSQHLIRVSQKFGADPSKYHVIPFPAAASQPAVTNSGAEPRGRLRIIFAGTLMLQKGVQYIYEALHKRSDLPVQMKFFGSIKLTQFGVQRLMEVGTVHGPIARSQLHEEFRNADMLLFPSLCEGHALVTLEAAALGVPVVATRESGASSSAMLIASRSPEAIIEAIEAVIADRELLHKLSEAGLAEAKGRNLGAYAENIVESLVKLVSPAESTRRNL